MHLVTVLVLGLCTLPAHTARLVSQINPDNPITITKESEKGLQSETPSSSRPYIDIFTYRVEHPVSVPSNPHMVEQAAKQEALEQGFERSFRPTKQFEPSFRIMGVDVIEKAAKQEAQHESKGGDTGASAKEYEKGNEQAREARQYLQSALNLKHKQEQGHLAVRPRIWPPLPKRERTSSIPSMSSFDSAASAASPEADPSPDEFQLNAFDLDYGGTRM